MFFNLSDCTESLEKINWEKIMSMLIIYSSLFCLIIIRLKSS